MPKYRPLRDYLEIRTAAPANFSRDGSKVLVQSNLSGTAQLYVIASSGGDLHQITEFDEPVGGAYLPTRDEVVLSMDAGGNERTQLSVMADDGSNLRPLVHDPEHIHRVGGVTRDGSVLAYASNARNGTDFDVYVVPLASSGSDPRLVFDMGGWCQPAGFSPDGRWLAVSRLTERSGDNDVYLVDVDTREIIHVSPHEDDARFSSPSWLPDSSGFFFSTDQGRDLSAIARYDLAARSWAYVLEREWDASCTIDWPGRTLMVETNEDGATEIELLDPATLTVKGEVPLPGRGVAGIGFSRDGARLAYSYTSPVEPGDAWVYDLESQRTTRLTSSPRGVPADEMVEPELHRFASFDGEQIPVFLYRPRTTEATPPVVVWVHGGPESQYVPSFNPVIQYLVARGYAVAAPNVRGSTGYGKRFSQLDDRRKRLDSVADLAALHDWLRGTGGVDGGRAALFGGSYGGYMVLAGLAFQPERWAAGVSVVGISSLKTFLENTAAWRRKFREREYGSLADDADFLLDASPLTHADAIRAPLFLIHGENDPRVPVGEARQIYDLMRAKGIRSELLIYPDEGHGLAKLKNRLDAYPKAADFLDEVLGVR
ncbi:MAG: S9 family peptidase [Acidimicrobiia bacterium]|nr:S9 family peptidase [Acidimicrobiia bacterium]